VASATPYRLYGGGRSHPQAFGGGQATPKGHQKKKKKTEEWVWPLGVAGPPPRTWAWPKPPPMASKGWPKPPQEPKPIARSFFFFGLLGWPDHPQRPGGWLRPPHTGCRGGSNHPDFLLLFFLFFYFPLKKTKILLGQNYTILGKTTSFWASPKRRSFGANGSLDNLPPKWS
jgi:hypothetical protein